MNTAAEPEVEDDQNELTGSYTFEQLSEKAKNRAREQVRYWEVQDEWYDGVYEDADRMGALMGIEIGTRTQRTMSGGYVDRHAIWFAGFCSQGDGASFTGMYACKPDAVKAITEECGGLDAELISIAEELTVLQVSAKLEFGGAVSGNITTSGGHYSHSGTMQMDAVSLDDYIDDTDEERFDYAATDKLLTDLMRRFADWIYCQLEQEYKHLTSDEVIDERLRDDMFFDEDGEII